MDTVIRRVEEYFGIPDLRMNTRKGSVIMAKHICVYILSRHFKKTNKELTKKFGFATRPSVIWSCRVVDNMIETDPEWAHDVNQLSFSCIHGTKQLPKNYKSLMFKNIDSNGFKEIVEPSTLEVT